MTGIAEELLAHVEALDTRAALAVVDRELRRGADIGRLVVEGLAPVQRTVGARWHRGAWNVAQEHAATAVVDDVLAVLATHVTDDHGGTVALVCAEDEWHVTPARMAAVVWRAAGWRVSFLGGSTPVDHLRATFAVSRPDVVAVSCTLPLALSGAGRVAAMLAELGLPSIGGGRAFGPDDHRAAVLGLDGWAPSAPEAAELLTTWLDHPPPPRDPKPPDGEELSLELVLPELVQVAEGQLEHRFPPMREYDERQRARTREDLAYLLRFAAVSLAVDDDRVFHDFLRWLVELLDARGVPAAAVDQALEALATVTAHLPRTAALLRSQRPVDPAAVVRGLPPS